MNREGKTAADMQTNSANFATEDLILSNRRTELNLKGVTDVISFDEFRIVVKVGESTLTIEGEGMQICQLSLESGAVGIKGKISAFYYTDSKCSIKDGFWSKWGK